MSLRSDEISSRSTKISSRSSQISANSTQSRPNSVDFGKIQHSFENSNSDWEPTGIREGPTTRVDSFHQSATGPKMRDPNGSGRSRVRHKPDLNRPVNRPSILEYKNYWFVWTWELGVGTINKLLKVAARPHTSLSWALSNMRIIAYALGNLLHRHHRYCGFIFIFYFS